VQRLGGAGTPVASRQIIPFNFFFLLYHSGDLSNALRASALVIQDLCQLESRKFFSASATPALERRGYAVPDRDDRNIPFTGNERRHSLQALSARLKLSRSEYRRASNPAHPHPRKSRMPCATALSPGLENLGRAAERQIPAGAFPHPAKHSHLCVGVVRRRTESSPLYAERLARVKNPACASASTAS